jgi:hypothetical protein
MIDYTSLGINAIIPGKQKQNGEFSAKIQAYIDQLKLIYRLNLEVTEVERMTISAPRNTFSGSFSGRRSSIPIFKSCMIWFTRAVTLVCLFIIYFTDNSAHVEQLPSTRLKFQLAYGRYFAGDKVILRDGIVFITTISINLGAIQAETVVKITPFFR